MKAHLMTEIQDFDGQLVENPLSLNLSNFTVLVGENNSGKSTLLRYMCRNNPNAHLININRTVITGEGATNKDYVNNIQGYSAQIKDATDDNVLNKNIQVLQELFNLNDGDRNQIINYYNKYFPDKAVIERENIDNTASAQILKMNGFSITKQGSGARAILEILVKIFDPNIELICIDEPELALEPKLQKKLYQAIQKVSKSKKIVIATHSHHFLDRDVISNNYVCKRNRLNKITVTRVRNEVEIRNIIFKLLGSDLSDISLPNKLIIVEGVSDVAFIQKVLILVSRSDYSIFPAESDSKIKPAIEGISAYLKFVKTLAPVYKDRIWVISDRQTDDKRIREWRTLLDDQANQNNRVNVLTKNGIEYYYPENILQSIFSTQDPGSKIVKAYLASSPNTYNSITLSKHELATRVVDKLKKEDLSPSNELVDLIKSLGK